MSRVLSAKDICERSLRAIGEFPVTESAPDGEKLREAMTWLDLIMGETVGTMRMFSRIDSTLSFTIENGTQSYDLFSTLGEDLPTDRIQYVVHAYLEDGDGNRSDIEIVNREKFESVSDPALTGTPIWIYIDRLASPTLYLYPTPHEDDTTEWTLKLVGQRFAPNVAPAGVTGTQPQSSVLHDMGQAWQRWLVLRLAHDLGMGPVVKLPEPSLTRFQRSAMEAKEALDAFENREHQTTEPICDGYDPGGY